MRCPVDNETLVMADRNGVEIDYCPKCRGVWLDRGELDKIIERVGAPVPAARPAPPPPPVAAARAPGGAVPLPEPGRDTWRGDDRGADRGADRGDDRRWRDDDDDRYRYGKRRRKESFLSDLFDF